jgi:predicted dehydrogenase
VPIRIAVVGVGFGTLIHAPGFQSEGLEVAAICDDDVAAAQKEADRLGVARVETDYERLLATPGIDAVSITGPTSTRYEMIMAALRAGKHVVSEKPFTLSAAKAKEMADTATSAGLTAMVAHIFRFSSGSKLVKELIAGGYVGTPMFALVRILRGPTEVATTPPPFDEMMEDASAGGGFLFRIGSHYIDGLRHWFGEIVEVEGRLLTTFPERTHNGERMLIDGDDTFFVTLRFENGVVAQLTGARSMPFASDFSLTVSGSEGVLTTPQPGLMPPSHGTVLGARLADDQELRVLEVPDRLEPFEDPRDDRLMPFRLFVREFCRGVEEGSSPSPNFYDGYRCMQVLEAVRESSQTGRRVTLRE